MSLELQPPHLQPVCVMGSFLYPFPSVRTCIVSNADTWHTHNTHSYHSCEICHYVCMYVCMYLFVYNVCMHLSLCQSTYLLSFYYLCACVPLPPPPLHTHTHKHIHTHVCKWFASTTVVWTTNSALLPSSQKLEFPSYKQEGKEEECMFWQTRRNGRRMYVLTNKKEWKKNVCSDKQEGMEEECMFWQTRRNGRRMYVLTNKNERKKIVYPNKQERKEEECVS